jgi:hypothetical protein
MGDKPKHPKRVEGRMGMILLVVVALAGLAVIVVLVASALSGGDDAKPAGSSAPINRSQVDGGGAAGSRAAAPSGSGGAAAARPAKSAESGPSDRPTANGLRKHIEPSFTIDVPTGTTGSSHNGTVSFRNGDGTRQISVRPLEKPLPDLLAGVIAAEDRAEVAGVHQDYKRLRLAAVTPPPYPGTDVVDWEFTHTENGVAEHVLARWVNVPGTGAYIIRWASPDATWAETAPERAMVFDSFTPVRTGTAGGS